MVRFGQQLTYAARNRKTGSKETDNLADTVLAAARAAEEVGLDSVWYPDHFLFRPDDPDVEVEVMECFTMLAAIAVVTERVRLGQYVAGTPYRNPAMMAKMYTTLDVISHGRSIVGIGAAWHDDEFRAYGWRFPPAGERLDRLEEAVQIVTRMLTESPVTFTGKYYAVQDALNYPRPIQQPRPPIMIGGGGERRTLRLVAEYADMYNTWGGDPGTVAHKFEVLRRHCEDVGRPYEEITRSNHVTILLARNESELAAKKERYTEFSSEPPVIGTPETVIARIKEYAAAGSQYLIFDLVGWHDLESIYLFAEQVMPALRDV